MTWDPKQVLSDAPFQLVAIDRHADIQYFNKALAEHLGSLDDVCGRDLFEVMPGLKTESEGVCWENVIRNHVLQEGRHVHLPRYGVGGAILDMEAWPIEGGAVLKIRNVTEEAQRGLIEQQAQRDQAMALLGSSVAHEIRNPLNALSLNLQLLEEQLDPDTEQNQRELAQAVQQEVKRLNAVVNEFLRAARPPQTNPEMASPLVVMQRAADLIESEARLQNIEVIKRGHFHDSILLDPERILEVLLNIGRNALEVLSPDKGVITFHCEATAQQVVLSVSDNGPGISEDMQNRIFDLYFSTKQNGSGLGLAHARAIVHAHGGTLTVDSRPGQGATFKVSLPRSIKMGS